MKEYQWLINQRAAEKQKRAFERICERDRMVHFDEYTHVMHGIANPRAVPQKERRRLYREYQAEMIHMNFLEWDRARIWGLPEFIDLFGK